MAKDSKDKPAEVKGSVTYLLKAPHYRSGVMYEAGQKITVVDEVPSKKWAKVAHDKKAPVLVKCLTPKEQAELGPPPAEEEAAAEAAPAAPVTSAFAPDKKRPNDKGI